MNSTDSIKRLSTGIIAGIFASTLMLMASATMTSAKKPSAAEAAKPGSMTITDIVLLEDGEFDVLQAAVVKAGLAGVLDGNRQFTVFAPTDAAFVDSLGVANESEAIDVINSLDSATLTDILLYHVTSGRKISTAVVNAPSQQMLNGDKLPIGEVVEAGLALPDQSARNGVIHVINSVLGL